MCYFQYFKGTTGNIPLAHTDVRMMPLKWKIRPLLFSKCSNDSLLTCSKRQSWVQTPRLSSVCFSNCISWPHPLSPMPWPSRWFSAALGRLSLLVLACTSSPRDLNGSLSPPRSDLFWSHSWKEHPWTPTVLCISHLPSCCISLRTYSIYIFYFLIYSLSSLKCKLCKSKKFDALCSSIYPQHLEFICQIIGVKYLQNEWVNILKIRLLRLFKITDFFYWRGGGLTGRITIQYESVSNSCWSKVLKSISLWLYSLVWLM